MEISIIKLVIEILIQFDALKKFIIDGEINFILMGYDKLNGFCERMYRLLIDMLFYFRCKRCKKLKKFEYR
jgi:hypothetical protein